jgi:nitroreductase
MADTLSESLLEELVSAGIRAPSSHNTQPWLFERTSNGLAVLADRTRALAVNDPYDRELTISCGAALFNIEVAAAHLGYATSLDVLPDPDNADLLTEVTITPRANATRADELYNAIETRQTTREPFDPEPISDALRRRLSDIAENHNTALMVVGDDKRRDLAELVAEGDRIQFADRRWRRELASWMHPRRKGDGLVVPEVAGLATRAVVTAFDVGKSIAGKDHDLITDAPLVAVLSTGRDDAGTWIEAGRALEHILLVAAADGLQVGYLNQPCQVDSLRGRLQTLLEPPQYPQVVMRFGKPSKASRRAPRRPVQDVLVTR